MISLMCASNGSSFDTLTYPLWMSIKYDGIRCTIRDGVALSRQMKKIPNYHVQNLCRKLPHGFDGELVTKGGDERSYEATSIIMRHEGEPEFDYMIFDYGYHGPFHRRMDYLYAMAEDNPTWPSFCKIVTQNVIENADQARAFFESCCAAGHEGAIARKIDGLYKFGRVSQREGYVIKFKGAQDEEATVIGFEPMLSVENLKGLPTLSGYEGDSEKIALAMVGKIVCKFDDGVVFRVGSGFTEEQRLAFWTGQDSLKFTRVTVKYNGVRKPGEGPRHPVFKGFRHD